MQAKMLMGVVSALLEESLTFPRHKALGHFGAHLCRLKVAP